MEQLQDSLRLAKEIIQHVPYSYWAEKEPWKIIIMCWTVFNLHSLEGAIFYACWRRPAVVSWFRNMAEDSDGKPNLRDGVICILMIIIFWLGRGIVVAGIWHVVFHEDQITLIGTLAAAIGAVVGAIIGLYKALNT